MPDAGGIDATGAQELPPEINTGVPQSARVYDYWLGGKDHFPADRALGDAIAEALPTIRTQVRAQRAFLGRAVRYLARDAGVRQFLDIGTGIPSAGNVHDVAQEIATEARVLYVDNDPIVLAHARALMGGTEEGRVAFLQADLRDPEAMGALAAASEQGGIANVPRSLADTEPFFARLELVEPGLVPMATWRPDPGSGQDPRSVYAYGAVARKP
jgi:hypothetical protein